MGWRDVGRQFILLLWKNFILQIRRPIGSIFELIIPPLAVLFVIALRYSLFTPQDRCFVTFDSDHLTLPSSNSPFDNTSGINEDVLRTVNLIVHNYSIFYTPKNNNSDAVAELIRENLMNDEVTVTVVGVEPDDLLSSLEDVARTTYGCLNAGAGVIFNSLENDDFDYTIRLRHEVRENSWNTESAAPEFETPGPRVLNSYLTEGFLHLENAIGKAIIQWVSNKTEPDLTVDVRQFPYPSYEVNIFLLAIEGILPLLLMLAYIYSAGVFVKELVLEKETRIRESMFMMGLSQWILWSTWYLKQFLFLFIAVFIMTILLKVAVFTNSDFFLLLIFLVLFTLASISWGFLISVWFNTARVGLLVGFLAWFINYLPFFFIQPIYDDDLGLGGKVSSCMLSNTCLGLGVTVLARLEIREEGLQWDNASDPLSLDDDFHMGYVFMMLILDAIAYYVVAWYVNAVKPGQYGVPKPLYFPFLPSYWIGRPLTSKVKEARDLIECDDDGSYDPSAYETEPKDLGVGISIKNLTKVYDTFTLHRKKAGGRKVAVRSLNLNMYKGQITALLGHNGAGKTTTISMLTGLYTPTSGTAIINDYDIVTDMDQIRRSLGVCPQHNVLFDRLTVWEHLSFFCRLKGVWGAQMKKEVENMIGDLLLSDKKSTPSSQLSGGMKRKLSVGIALVGGSEIVFLDEPTSGMDPYARRATWDLLIKHREGRTVLLTTHFMDEADLLGDRIAIMAEGRLKCSGSSLFLKGRYGVGYHMVVVKEAECNSAKVTELVKFFVRGAEQVTDVGAELSFILPSASASSFPALFDSLEARKGELGVSSFGISVTTMEEVFIKVGEGDTQSEGKWRERLGTLSPEPTTPGPTTPGPTTPGPAEIPTKQSGDGTVVEDMEIQAKVDLTPAVEGGQTTATEPVEIEVRGTQGAGTGTLEVDTNRLTEYRIPSYTPNSGIVLWVQQFCAIFLKRVYNSIRFWAALISQLILPMVFVLLSLGLAESLPDPFESDPSRTLRLDNSGFRSGVSVFYADFSDGSSGIRFSDISPRSIRAGSLEDFTAATQAIINETIDNNYNDSSQCCNYDYQLLDQFCATRDADILDTCVSSSSYKECTQCLSCCEAQSSTFASCTNPLSVISTTPKDDLCPSPPLVSVRTVMSTNPTGRLDSDNAYIAEHLLKEADRADVPSDFFRDYHAGFVITSERDPAFSVCGCSNSSTTCALSPAFNSADDGSGMAATPAGTSSCPYYTVEPLQGSGCDGELPGCYSVDGLSAGTTKGSDLGYCSKSFSDTYDCGIPGQRPVGATYPDQTNQTSVTVWYNNQPFHMAAAALNTFHNIWLRTTLGRDDVTITVRNHPLPRNLTAQVENANDSLGGYAISTLTVFGYSFLVATFILFLVQEKEIKAKHLQFVSGVHVTSYWTATFLWDLINALLPVFVSFIFFAGFQIDAYSDEGLAAVLLLFLFTVWASIPLTYCFSFLFTNSLAAFGVLILFYYFVAFALQTTVVVVEGEEGPDTADTLHYIFLLMPSYGLAIGLQDIYTNNALRDVCTESPEAERFCDNDDDIRYVDNPLEFARPGIGSILLYMALEGIFFFMLTILLEHSFFIPELKGLLLRNSNGKVAEDPENPRTSDPVLIHGEDSDVYNERKKVLTGATDENDVVVIKELVKVYSRSLDGCTIRPPKTAVRGISLAIPKGECFGLLGVNGAGKTTTFSMLTGDISMTDGTAIIAGYDIRTHLQEVQQRVGYCPQFDAVLERLTGRELLTMFARIRGIPEQYIKEVVDVEIKRLDLDKHADKYCGKYSGGNKRKLSTAIALVGNAPIVFLDEPTTGMDPATRRFLWDVLTSITQEGRSIVLTSHSMEECEALCTRIAIMVNGSFKCLGSIQHLKNKYGAGFTLQARVMLSAPSEPEAAPFQRKKFSFRRQFSKQSSIHEAPDQPMSPRSPSVSATPTDISLGGSGAFNPFDTTSLNIFIKEAFPGALLLEEHQGTVTYQLPSEGISWSSVFRQLENNKERLGIVDYSVSQTTLDQVFINFAKEQEESDQ